MPDAGALNGGSASPRAASERIYFPDVDGAAAVDMRSHYESLARGTLRAFWRHKWLTLGIVLSATLLAILILALLGPRYQANVIIEPPLVVGETHQAASVQSIPSIDPAALVENEIHLIRSRTIATAVVVRLGLDHNPTFTQQSIFTRTVQAVQAGFRLDEPKPDAQEIATNSLLARVEIKNVPRSYLISVSAASALPNQGPLLADTIALEYLRWRANQNVNAALAAAERELADLSSRYGDRHPAFQLGMAHAEELRSTLQALRNANTISEVIRLAPGPKVLTAGATGVPSGPSIPVTILLAGSAALIGALLLSRRLELHTADRPTVESHALLEPSGARTIDPPGAFEAHRRASNPAAE